MLDELGFITTEKKVQLKPYVARQSKIYELMNDQEIQIGAGGTLILDTETYINYFIIAFKDIKTGKIIRFELNNQFDKLKLSWIMHSYRIVGFNSIKYDLPLIWLSYAHQNIKMLKEASDVLIFDNIFPNELQRQFNFQIHKTNHIDLIEVCPLKGSLKLYAARLHSKRIQDLPFDISKPLTKEQIEIVADYNLNDLDATELIFNFSKERLDLRQVISIEYKQDLMSKSDAQIAEAVISSEVQKINGRYPKRPIISPGTTYNYNMPHYIDYQIFVLKKLKEEISNAKFIVNQYGRIDLPKALTETSININKSAYRLGIGGLHSFEKNVSYIATEQNLIIDRDVSSYYPTIILNQGLYPLHMGKAFIEVYKGIVQRRLIAKKNKQYTIDKGLKIAINGSFGKLGSMWSILYSPDLMIQITITGQLTLLMLIEMIELAEIQVISANTDGIVILCSSDREADLEKIIKKWENLTGFSTEETRYKAYYARDVNAYFAVKMNNEIKVKGPYSEIGSQSGTQLDNNPASLICSDAIKKLLGENIPIEKTIQECRNLERFVTVRNVKGGAHKDQHYLGKVIRFYYAKNIVGTINYILSGNKVPDTEGAKPTMDMPEQFPDDINYRWYIDKTNEILYEIGYYKETKFF